MGKKEASVVLFSALAPFAALAGPADYVFTPAVTYGEREIDLKGGRAGKSGEDRERAWSIGLGYGVTQTWFTEIYRKYESAGSESLSKFDAWEWENKFQLTEPGQYLLDLGFIVELERPKDRGEGYEMRAGPLLQKETGRLQWNANLLVERHFRAQEPQHWEPGYQWQVKYRYRPSFEFGMQGFGEELTHRLGPAVFGKLPVAGRQAIRYNAAWLLGVADRAPQHTFRFQLEYEF